MFGAEFVTANVTSVTRLDDGTFETVTDTGDVYRSPAVIVTAGGTPIKLGIPGEQEFAGKGVSYCAICDGAFFRSRRSPSSAVATPPSRKRTSSRATPTKVYVIHRRDTLPRVEDPAGAAVRESEDRSHLEHGRRGGGRRRAGADERAAHPRRRHRRDAHARRDRLLRVHRLPAEHRHHRRSLRSRRRWATCAPTTMMQTSIPGLFAAGDLRSQLTRQVTTAVGDATTAAIAVEKYLKARSEGGHAIDPRRKRRLRRVKIDHRTVGRLRGELLPRHRRDERQRACSSIRATRRERSSTMVRASGATLEAIWLTHAHIDHIGAIAGVRRVSTCPCCLHPRDLPYYDALSARAARDVRHRRSSSRTAPDRELPEGDVAALRRARSFTVMHVPGHAPGLVSFNGARRRARAATCSSPARSAAPIFRSAIRPRWTTSLARYRDAAGRDRSCYPGHGPARRRSGASSSRIRS